MAKGAGTKRKRGENSKVRNLEDNLQECNKQKKLNQSAENKWKDDYSDILKEKYGIEFADDFYQFFEFIKESKNNPLELLNISLCGPYDFLQEKISKDTSLSKVELHMHGRFYYDIPEVMTVLYKDDGFHVSYFRDSPSVDEQIVVSNTPSINGDYQICGDNIFAALYLHCKNQIKLKKCDKIAELKSLCSEIENECKTLGLSLEQNSTRVKSRSKKTVSKCFHKAGMVVPLDDSGVGYRELPSSDRELKKLFTRICEAKSEDEKNEGLDEIQEMITLIQFANDECDYGMGYELGVNLFTFGNSIFHGMISHLLTLAYQFLSRDLFADILERHLELRENNGKPLNMLDEQLKNDEKNNS